jgi:diacylglycerol kinase
MSLDRRIRSFGYAYEGIKQSFLNQCNIKIHCYFALAVLVAGIVFRISIPEWTVCFLCIGLVISLEMMNTAIEKVVDLASPDLHILAKHAKDIAAGAVLVSSIISAIIGLLIFIPKVLVFIHFV